MMISNASIATRRFFKVAAAAAVVASACDFVLLYTTVSPPALVAAARSLVVASGVLGAIAIPFYAPGYVAIARCMDPGSAVLRAVVIGSGIVVGVGGGVIHGATAVFILRAQAAGATWEDPMIGALHSGVMLPMLWGLVLAAALCASVVLVYAAFTERLTMRRAVALVNPVIVTVLLVVVALASGWQTLSSFLAPAAPNLGHALFFVVAAASLEPGRG